MSDSPHDTSSTNSTNKIHRQTKQTLQTNQTKQTAVYRNAKNAPRFTGVASSKTGRQLTVIDAPSLVTPNFSSILARMCCLSTMTQDLQPTPRYLTNDKPGLKEFLNKFDVHIHLCIRFGSIANVFRFSFSTAMVCYPFPLWSPQPTNIAAAETFVF